MLLQSQSPPSFSPGALEAGLQVCWAAAGGAGGGREPRVWTGGGRSRRAASLLPGSLQRGRSGGAPGSPMGTEREGPGTTQVSPARGLPFHRVPLSHDPARHPPSPSLLHPSSDALSQARRSPRCTPNSLSAPCFLQGGKKREASRCGAKRGAGRQGEGAGTYSAKRGAEHSGQETQARLPGARNPAGRQVKRLGPDGVGDRDSDRTDARVGSARVAFALRSGRGSARLRSRLPSGSLAPTPGSHMTPAPLALRASPGLAG